MKVKEIVKQLLTADQEAEAFIELIDEVGAIKSIQKFQLGEDNDPEKKKIVVFATSSLYELVKATGFIE